MASSESCLAARYYKAHEPLKLERVRLPVLTEYDVLVEIKAAGICHSDVHVAAGSMAQKTLPMTLGHEGSGIVTAKGAKAGFEIGDRVGIEFLLGCGNCRYCKQGKWNLCDEMRCMGCINADGTWTEKMVVPDKQLRKLPKNVDFPEGAVLMCAGLTSYHAAKWAGISEGDSVMIFGLGGVGLNVVQWAKLFGAKEIIGVDLKEKKLQLAKNVGATYTINPSETDVVKEVKEITGDGVDIGFEVIGKPATVRSLMNCVRKTGKAVIVGICSDDVQINPANDLTFKEMTLMSPIDHSNSDAVEAFSYVESGRFDLSKVVSHKLNLNEVNEGMKMLEEQKDSPVRIVLQP